MMGVADEWVKITQNVEKLLLSIENTDSTFPNYGRDWGPWIEWWGGSDGFGPAGLAEASVNVYRRSPLSEQWLVQEAHRIRGWEHDGGPHDVLAYRVRVYPERPPEE